MKERRKEGSKGGGGKEGGTKEGKEGKECEVSSRVALPVPRRWRGIGAFGGGGRRALAPRDRGGAGRPTEALEVIFGGGLEGSKREER